MARTRNGYYAPSAPAASTTSGSGN